MGTGRDDFPWKDLLTSIRDRSVVPILGRELLTLADGSGVLLDHELARRLAAELDVDVSGSAAPVELRDVATAFAQQRPDEREIIYSSLRRILDELDPAPPVSLRKLAEITDFRLLVSTTFDDLVGRALDAARGRAPLAERRAFTLPQWRRPPQPGQDSVSSLLGRDNRVVFHIFGEISAQPDYAVAEADTLEFVHQLQAAPPQDLFDVIDRQQLLFIGCGFPDWLSRFFVRAMKHQPLSTSRPAAIVDDIVRGEARLVLFLKQNKTRVYHGSAVDFVDMLHATWTADRQQRAQRAGTKVESERDPLPEGGVFLSYASEDRPLVQRVQSELARLNLDAWFDRRELEPGDEYKTKILQTIESCSMFVPFVSTTALQQTKRFFWAEWNHALEQAKLFAPKHRFIVPTSVDGTAPEDEGLPHTFKTVQWIRNSEPAEVARQILETWRANKLLRVRR
jgi:hypothetical protein